MGIINYHNLEDSELFIFDQYIINQVKEGVVIDAKFNDTLNAYIQKYFSGKKMVYISNRAKSYSVNPLVISEIGKIPNLIAVAMIPDNEVMRKSAEFEKEFYNKPYKIFDCLSDAIFWVHKIIRETNADD
ncbi:MAG: hypothetical protein WA749_12155 [Gelidibacter sp.]